ncbi:UNVERIFIED_CONTAM: hypothetical protein Sradi_6179700 [Sesamum radiatum]|uniref:Uncharacterized protein n=1 Tax=Sesamum radiatum TaxID=300843 RepID=A0AAW2KAJ2_SESRA
MRDEGLVPVPILFSAGQGRGMSSRGKRGRGRAPRRAGTTVNVIDHSLCLSWAAFLKGRLSVVTFLTKHLMIYRRRLLRNPAGGNESPCLELSGVGVPLDSSGRLYAIGCVQGILNEILSQDEKTGAPRPRKQIEEFRDCLLDCQLSDLGFRGAKFTWSNHREGAANVFVRLDRACASPDWTSLFPAASVMTEKARGSDHAPLVISLDARLLSSDKRRRKLFRFEAMWTRNATCGVISRA